MVNEGDFRRRLDGKRGTEGKYIIIELKVFDEIGEAQVFDRFFKF